MNYKNYQSSAGFTLIELLVAASITTIVVSIAGSGLVSIMQNNSRAEAETLRRVELNRALDFMSDEVRTAKTIAKDVSAANLGIVAPGFNSSSKTPVLTLEIPGVSQRVIYYIASASSPWLGPKVIYRWGPTFKADGNYSNPSNTPVTNLVTGITDNNPADWKGNALVDLIAATTPTCTTSGWTANNGQGFTACIDSTGKIAEIRLRGELRDAYNNLRTPLEVSTKTFARPYTPTFTTGGGTGTGTGTEPGGGTITFTQPSTAYFEIIGGDTSGIPTTTTINQTLNGTTVNKLVNASTKSLNLSAATGTTLTITGRASGFSYGGKNYGNFSVNSETNKTAQVWTLRNGYTPPPFNAYTGQAGIDTIVAKYLDANGKIKLAENQVIYLFEVITTDKTDSFYDMQDIVVLATITPS